MAATSGSRLPTILIACSTVAMAAFVAAFAPHWTIAFNDDFAYLRSVVETLQHGRPWTDDFLEPWALSLTAISAGIYRVSGSFTLATLGLQIAMPMVSFAFAAAAIRRYRPSLTLSLLLPAILLTFPTMLWKQAELTAFVVYLPALWAMLWCVGAESWIGFGFAYAVAVASRQSAVAWLAFPIVAGVIAAYRGEPRKCVRPGIVVLAGIGWYLLLRSYANQTHAQQFITGHLFESMAPRTVSINLTLAAWAIASAAGAVSLATWAVGYTAGPPNVARRAISVLIGLGLLVSVRYVGDSVPLAFEHPLFDNPWATLYLRGLVVLGAAGWIVAPPKLNAAYGFAAASMALIVCLRSELWDYYLTDAVIVAICGVLASSAQAAARKPAIRVSSGIAAVAMLCAIVGLQIAAAGALKRSLDERAAACAILEKALRAGWMKPTELSHAPFGFVAWHLFPYYLRHEGNRSGDLAGFGVYVAEHAVDIRTDDLSWRDRNRVMPADATHAFSEVRPHGWLAYARYYLVRRTDTVPPRVPLTWTDYDHPAFPLNDGEWRALIEGRPIATHAATQ